MEENRKLDRALKRANDAFYKARKSSIKKVRNEKRVQKLERKEEFRISKMLLEATNV